MTSMPPPFERPEDRKVREVEIDFSYDVDSDGLEDDELHYESDESQDSATVEYVNTELAKAEALFSEEQMEQMVLFLRKHGMVDWLKEYVVRRNLNVRDLLLGFGVILSHPPDDEEENSRMLPLLKLTLIRILRKRPRDTSLNTVEDVIRLLKQSKRVIILTGAGISVSCGIPDFRSSTGIYAMLKREGKYDLEDPQQMFDIETFKANPQIFYSFASQIYPSNFIPSPCHRFIKALEDRDMLLRNYTQNIDTLESLLGVKHVIQCHGSFATASCILCHRQVPGKEIEHAILTKKIPTCAVCIAKASSPKKKSRTTGSVRKGKPRPWDSDGSGEDLPDRIVSQAIMKVYITFFGEPLTDRFDQCLFEDRTQADLLLVIGTSLKVAPVSEILTHLPHEVPQILINKTPIPHVNPDIILLGDADGIVQYLCAQLGWSLAASTIGATSPHAEPERVGKSHVWLFPGAEGGEWAERLRETRSDGPSEASGDLEAVQQLNLPGEGIRSSLVREREDEGRAAGSVKRSKLV